MSNIVISKHKLSKLCAAAENIQALLNDGIVGNAFGKVDGNSEHDVDLSVAAFDALQESAKGVTDEIRNFSPFLRYRNEFFGDHETAGRLRALVLNLYGCQPAESQSVSLSELFINADEHHARIALECIAYYAQHRERDTFFCTLASEILELPAVREVTA